MNPLDCEFLDFRQGATPGRSWYSSAIFVRVPDTSLSCFPVWPSISITFSQKFISPPLFAWQHPVAPSGPPLLQDPFSMTHQSVCLSSFVPPLFLQLHPQGGSQPWGSSESPGGNAGPRPQSFWLSRFGWAWELALLTSPQARLMLLVQGPPSENHSIAWFHACNFC